ncbi:MAG: hypothetical protein IT307_05310 [Chloroflexi bacterium]|nr:hypothetical protein [Chloroflexota bacterium]
MKSLVYLVAAVLLLIMLIFYRKRLKVAVLLGGGVYLGLIVIRMATKADDPDRFAEIGLALLLLGLVWLVVWLSTRLIERRRAKGGPPTPMGRRFARRARR